MYTLLVILNYLSVFTMLACVCVVATHESSKMQKLALLGWFGFWNNNFPLCFVKILVNL